MIIFPTPPAADPLHIFSSDGPINPAFMRSLLDSTIATQPLPADASPERHAEHRLATMHAIAAYRPGDALEATLAGQMVAANARMMRCFALAAEPDADKAEARRDGAQATALIRCTQTMLRGFQRQQAARRKDEEQPSERAGYWFHDVSVPAPDDAPPVGDPMGDPSRAATGRPTASERIDPMQSGDPASAAASRHPDPAPQRAAPPASGVRENPMHQENGSSARPTVPSRSPANATARRFDPMPSEDHDLPERMTTGDATMRFASRRLDPNEDVEAAWARAAAEADAEEAEAARR